MIVGLCQLLYQSSLWNTSSIFRLLLKRLQNIVRSITPMSENILHCDISTQLLF